MRVFLSQDYDCYFLTPVNKKLAAKQEKATGDESVIFQSDWDRPSLAEALGWNLRTAHKRNCSDTGSTDGTVTCHGCGWGASHFIEKATEWLDRHDGQVFQGDFDNYFQ